MLRSHLSVTVKGVLKTLNTESDGNNVLDDKIRARMPEPTCKWDLGSILMSDKKSLIAAADCAIRR